MSHSVKVTIIADQEISIFGDVINIHDLETLELDENGNIVRYGVNGIKIIKKDQS